MSDEIPVSIDRHFARFGTKSYAISKINTVDVTAKRPYSQNAFFGWGLLALISILAFTGEQTGAGTSNGTAVGVFLFALFGFLAYRAWKRRNIVDYYLMLVTSSHSVQAIKSRDPTFIDSVRDKIERAMTGQLD
jgi:hypothetical protein